MHNYHKGESARIKLMAGVMAGNEAVRGTLGAKGKDAILEAVESPYSIATNDGISVLERVKMDDPVENMGLNILKEAVSRANRQSGDGSTTTCVLTAAILEEGQKYVDSGEDIKQSLFDCLPLIHKSIDDQTKQITPEEVGKVATISAQSEEMGAMLQEIFTKIGKEGGIDWENSYSTETFYTVKDGVELKNVAFSAQWMANENAKGAVSNPYQADRAVMKNPKILITTQKISNISELEPYFKALSSQGIKEMVVFFDEIESLALQAMALTYLQGGFKVLALKAPTLWKDWIYDDFALMTGATILKPESGASFKTPSLTYLGTCEKIIAYRSGTAVIGTKDISEHISRIEEGGKIQPDLLARAAWLKGKTAVVKIGARSEVELTHKRAKLEDASNSAKIALQGGIVAGGGVCLLHAANLMPDSIGGKILREALRAPFRQIGLNAGVNWGMEAFVEVNTEDGSDSVPFGFDNRGFNAKTGEMVDMFEAGIIDAALIEKNAISSAISVAGTVLNADVAIPLPSQGGERYA